MTIPKFRVYDKVECMMITTSDYEDLSDLFCILKNDADTGYISEPMQSTGLVDENGEEIFEGDIVRFSIADGFEFVVDEIGLVAYQSGAFRVLNGLDEYLINDNEYLIDDIDEIEVIGNIYENPEPWGIGRYYDF